MAYLFILFGIFFSYANAACSIRDDNGNLIHLQKPAYRIISLAPDVTEILFLIGAGTNVIGVMQGSDYPSAAKQIPIVGSYAGLDLEKIISLHPDLIVTWNSRQVSTFKKYGIPVYFNDPHHLTDIPRTIKHLGCLTGTSQSAEYEAALFSRRLKELERKYHHQKKITLFYQIGSYSLITINRDSWINQAITLCGGTNIFAQVKLAAPEVTWEAVVAANPQMIISDATDVNWKSRWLKWTAMTAVKNKHLYSISPDIIERAGPRLLQGVEEMCVDIQNVRGMII